MSEADKKKVIDLIKSIDLQEFLIPDEMNKKYFRFGAYDMAAKITDKVKEMKVD